MSVKTQDFDWANELHKTMVHSLTTSFGLDFLLFEDRKGGNVDTVHKVRGYQKDLAEQGYSDINVSGKMASKLTIDGKNKESYDSHAYHQHAAYIERGRRDKDKHQSGDLFDKSRGVNMKVHEKRQLDHTVSTSEVHHDAGRILAGINGVELANQEANFASILGYVNNKKSDMPMEEFIAKLPDMKKEKRNKIKEGKEKLEKMSGATPEERHKKRQIEDAIRKEQEHLESLESIDTKAMLELDKRARATINNQVNYSYYTSSKFFKAAALDMGSQGLRMGMRQAFGMLLAEIWFELREALPNIYQKCRIDFQLKKFMSDIGDTFKNIIERVKVRFKEMLNAFKDGILGGILASITSTIFNAFQTIAGNTIKIIRETWGSLVKAVKLIFFNPDKLSAGDLAREVSRIVGAAAAVSVGTVVHNAMIKLLEVIPFDFIRDGLAAFAGAMVTGVLTVGMGYFLDHSKMMKKVWDYLNGLKSQYERIAERYCEINVELDRYLMELARLEFNLNPVELSVFAYDLKLATTELERKTVLDAEIQRRNIQLPFESGNADSIRKWLSKK